MNLRLGWAFAIVLAMAPSARAVSLVVMSVNSTAVPGSKVFTLGVRVDEADLTAPGTLNNPPLFVQNVTFVGGPNGPIHQTGAANRSDIQSIQTSFIDNAAVNGPATSLSTNGTNALYRDTWWYASGDGRLQGIVDKDGNLGTVTTNPAGDGSGVYTLGPTNNVGTTGFTFMEIAQGTSPAFPTTGQTMYFSGLYGVLGSNTLTNSPLHDLFVNGTLTVPLVQLVASGDIAIPSDWKAGAGTGLIIGQRVYNVLGGNANTDPHAYLDYANNKISVPEPTTLMLAGCGVLALVGFVRRSRVAKIG